MAGRLQHYRSELKKRRGDWESYLKANSGLPGPRANLELVEAVGEEADADLLWRLSASSDEFLALCGTAGLGRLVAADPTVLPWLKELAEDPRWRVREGVAIALQRFGRAGMPGLIAEMEAWSKAGPLVQRAAAAAVCEPSLLKKPDEVKRVLQILDHITRSMAATRERTHESFHVLRQAMGYCWSVAAAANPEAARPLLEKWLRSSDPDIAWVMKSNLGKARMSALGTSWLAQLKVSPARSKSKLSHPMRKP
jgi:HEAT repeat protein